AVLDCSAYPSARAATTWGTFPVACPRVSRSWRKRGNTDGWTGPGPGSALWSFPSTAATASFSVITGGWGDATGEVGAGFPSPPPPRAKATPTAVPTTTTTTAAARTALREPRRPLGSVGTGGGGAGGGCTA